MKSPREQRYPSAAWLLSLGAVLALFGAQAGRYWDFTVDDAGISFAYARNLAEGHGLVLTPGAERVEAATNLLWCLALAPAGALHLGHELLAKLLGLAASAGALALVARFPSVAYRRAPRLFDLVAPTIAALMPHYGLWAVAGLENGLFSFLAAAALVALAREEHDERRFPWSAPLLVLLFMTRPDGALYAVAFGAAKLLRALPTRPRLRQDVRWVAALAAGVGAVELFRLAYFAWPFPNSFYTKKRTFDFGKGLFTSSNPGLAYVRSWAEQYQLKRAGYALPAVLLARRAWVARVALLGSVAAALFFPVYSHGDWMEEWRFLSFGAPLFALALAEAARAALRLVLWPFQGSLRRAVALVAAPALAVVALRETTRHFPERWRAAATHSTLEMSWVRHRAGYILAAARALSVDRRPGLLDPDVGGSSYDGRLAITDMFGLGDVPIARTHPDDPPGSRESIFWERRPTFVHLHGAWFGAMELTRLEELDRGYFHLPSALPTGETDPDTNYARRESVAAPWYLTASLAPLPGAPSQGARPEGFTVSHGALEPGRALLVELTVAGAENGPAGVVTLAPQGAGASPPQQAVQPLGGAVDLSALLPGERPRARVRFTPPAGRYTLRWTAASGEAVDLGAVVVERGAGARESRQRLDAMRRALAGGRVAEAGVLARSLGLRVTADPGDRDALDALSAYGDALARSAERLAEGGAYRTAALLARAARAWAAHDGRVSDRAASVAGELASAARGAERRGALHDAFVLAREAVLTDPRRSWSRRRVEELRPRVVGDYDGGRDQAAYRFAASALASRQAVDLDRAIAFLGSVERWSEAAALALRAGHTPADPAARLVVARGLVARGEVSEARAMASAVPCTAARDAELTRALRALVPGGWRGGDRACEALTAPARAPFDDAEGSFEAARWGGWTVTGTAFGRAPVHARAGRQQFVNGWRGRYYANSFALGADDRVGQLRSRPFTIAAEGLSFLVGGGADPSRVGVRLRVDGEAVMSAAGADTEGLRRVFFDLRSLRGRTAVIEVYDDAADGSWAHVLADDFRLEPVAPPDAVAPTPR